MKKVFLYGLADETDMYQPMAYEYILPQYVSITEIAIRASQMIATNQNVKCVYAVDDYYGLLYDYQDAIRGTMDHKVGFKIMLEQRGFLVAQR